MKLKLNALSLAMLGALAAGGAHASGTFGNTISGGSSSMMFVAIDNDPNQVGNVSLAVDLGAQMADFLNQAGQTYTAGSLSAAGTVATWNLASNTFTVNGVAQTGTYAWSANTASFFSNSFVTSAGYQWGVIGGDTVSGTTASSANKVVSLNIVYTGQNDFDNSLDTGTTNGVIASAATAIDNFIAGSNGTGTMTAGRNGSDIATSGLAFAGTTIAQNGVGGFGGQFGTNNFLTVGTAGVTSTTLNWAQLSATSLAHLYQVGSVNSMGAALSAAQAGVFSFDASTETLTYSIPAVPEPDSYALIAVGLAAIGLKIRRRARR